MEIKITDIHIGDKVITVDNKEGIIVKIDSIEYLNYKDKVKGLLPYDILNTPFTMDPVRKKHKIYPVISLYDINNSCLVGIDITEIKKIITQKPLKYKKKSLFKKIFNL